MQIIKMTIIIYKINFNQLGKILKYKESKIILQQKLLSQTLRFVCKISIFLNFKNYKLKFKKYTKKYNHPQNLNLLNIT